LEGVFGIFSGCDLKRNFVEIFVYTAVLGLLLGWWVVGFFKKKSLMHARFGRGTCLGPLCSV
jgi:hypothetical protein